MRIVIAGASGLIGRALISYFLDMGYRVWALSRRPERMRKKIPETEKLTWLCWRNGDSGAWQMALKQSDAVINLMGASILGGRWTKKRKDILYRSRVDGSRFLAETIKKHHPGLPVYIQASAIGYYDNDQPQPVDESGSPGNSFLARLTRDWEEAAAVLSESKVTVYFLRLGMVLAPDSLVVRLLKPVFYIYKGGPVGNGRQIVSWIHIDDVCAICDLLLQRPFQKRVVNLTAPGAVDMDHFARAFGRAVNRPSWLRVPAWTVRVLLGEMGRETMLSGIRVSPELLREKSYRFKYADIETAFRAVVRKKKPS